MRIICEKQAWLTDKTGVSGMIGDINLFFGEEQEAEINLMIGEEGWRGKGLASEALLLTMIYATQRFNVRQFIAKIKVGNAPAIAFFQKHGFKLEGNGSPNVFGEIGMILLADDLPRTDLNIMSSHEFPL